MIYAYIPYLKHCRMPMTRGKKGEENIPKYCSLFQLWWLKWPEFKLRWEEFCGRKSCSRCGFTISILRLAKLLLRKRGLLWKRCCRERCSKFFHFAGRVIFLFDFSGIFLNICFFIPLFVFFQVHHPPSSSTPSTPMSYSSSSVVTKCSSSPSLEEMAAVDSYKQWKQQQAAAAAAAAAVPPPPPLQLSSPSVTAAGSNHVVDNGSHQQQQHHGFHVL